MAKFYSLLLHSGTLCMLFVAALTEDSAILCSDEDGLIEGTPRDVDMPSECVLRCTSQTYARILLRQDTRTVRFRSSQTGDDGYCWSTRISCSDAESLLQAYIIFPIDTSVINEVSLELQISSARYKNMLRPHRREALPPNECGLRFDVTDDFGGKNLEPNICVKVVPQHHVLEEGLRCSPFLVTIWQKKRNHSPVNHG